MNNDEQFESRLQREPLRSVPPDWRAEILRAAREVTAPRHSSPASRNCFAPHGMNGHS